jgi:hypothetical protein
LLALVLCKCRKTEGEGAFNPLWKSESGMAEILSRDFSWNLVGVGDNLSPMTWKTLLDLLVFEYHRLRGVPVVSFGFADQPLRSSNEARQIELALAARLDACARDFARTGRWPSLDEKARFFLRERIRFAHEYCSVAQISVDRPLNLATRPGILNERRRLLEWLLIDTWRFSGVVNWLDPLIMMEEAGNLAHKNGSELQISA